MPEHPIAFFARTNFRNQEKIFGIKTDDRRRHMYVIGKTGMGKTNLLENLVIQDIQNGHGVAYIDPHGDTAEKLIQAIPAHRINDVIYFNPADQDWPLAFNVMEKVNPEYRHLVSSGLVGVFKKIWAESWGPRLEYILRNAILALLEYPDSTLLGITRILVDKEYRKKVVDKLTDPVVRSFWVDEFTKWNDRILQEVISPIQNKVGQFLSTSLIRNVVGQTRSSFDVRDIMDHRKILILNLAKGRIGEDNSALLGAMMITKIQLAAMARVDTPEEERKDFYLYVDEFQNFATESFANILSEARKYRLNLTLANQYITQLEEPVRDAIFGNAGTLISFRVGAVDAEFMEKEFEPSFMMNDLVNLPKFHVYLKLMIDGIAGDAFSATTLPPIAIPTTEENADKVIRLSRERYATPKQTVEDKIRRWSGMLTEEERQALLSGKTAKAGVMNAARPPAPTPGHATAITPVRADTRSVIVPPMLTNPLRAPSTKPLATYDRSFPPEARLAQGGSEASKIREGLSAPVPLLTFPAQKFSPAHTPTRTSGNMAGGPAASAPAMKPLYPARCVVCETDIMIPFEPDGSRPTFCKDHLKEYQRALAKARADTTAPVASRDADEPTHRIEPSSSELHRGEPKTYQPTAHPMSLNQMQYMAPQKFKTHKPLLPLGEIRALIQKSGGRDRYEGEHQSDRAVPASPKLQRGESKPASSTE